MNFTFVGDHGVRPSATSVALCCADHAWKTTTLLWLWKDLLEFTAISSCFLLDAFLFAVMLAREVPIPNAFAWGHLFPFLVSPSPGTAVCWHFGSVAVSRLPDPVCSVDLREQWQNGGQKMNGRKGIVAQRSAFWLEEDWLNPALHEASLLCNYDFGGQLLLQRVMK